jgi:hypothetical protein
VVAAGPIICSLDRLFVVAAGPIIYSLDRLFVVAAGPIDSSSVCGSSWTNHLFIRSLITDFIFDAFSPL